MVEKPKDKRISGEVRKLRKLFRDLPKDTLILLDGLIRRAAYMKISLEDYECDLNESGYVEPFSQSEKVEPYDRERPVARLYNSTVKNYQTIMKQLADSLPEPSV
jgi:hypothetical protein